MEDSTNKFVIYPKMGTRHPNFLREAGNKLAHQPLHISSTQVTILKEYLHIHHNSHFGDIQVFKMILDIAATMLAQWERNRDMEAISLHLGVPPPGKGACRMDKIGQRIQIRLLQVKASTLRNQVVGSRHIWISWVAIKVREVGEMFIPLLRESSEIRGVTKLRVTVEGVSLVKGIGGPWPLSAILPSYEEKEGSGFDQPSGS
ncbi:hypothetical protein BS47DRAFT_1369279 [Hydnum rufescens UP504]|uniref:Uncharacterized protein n=1 Tax=Hydnum rufescens UP504 TaxID=1448309 RepID=A0A9P6DMQ0_9AGAM|nr:hypothetical protein BS47DRAFT_1369279 [Hydnum rufescens UP504]